MKQIENKIKHGASMFDNIETPSVQNMLDNAILSSRGKKILLFPKRFAFIAIIILMTLSLMGTAIYATVYYYFNEGRSGFGKAQEDGYINVFDKTETHDNITLKVIAILSDGSTTYVRIAVDGELPSYDKNYSTDNPKSKDATDLSGSGIADYISEAILMDNNGQSWKFKNQVLSEDKDSSLGVINPILSWLSLNQNECVLIFYNTNVSDIVDFSLEIQFKGVDEHFHIEGLNSRIAPVITRDFSNENIFYEMPNAKVQILSATSTYLTTTFKLKWIVTLGFSQTQNDYDTAYEFEFKHGGISKYEFIFKTNLSGVDFSSGQAEIINEYTLGFPLPINEEITVNLIEMRGKKFVETLFVLPKK